MTGNHFILDAIAGAVAVLAAWLVAVRMPAAHDSQRERTLTLGDYERPRSAPRCASSRRPPPAVGEPAWPASRPTTPTAPGAASSGSA